MNAAEVPITVANRSFRYGDGLFETLRLRHGSPVFPGDHLQRLNNGMQILGLSPLPVNADEINNIILELARQNQLSGARVRIVVFRTGGGTYQPLSDKPELLITAEAIPADDYVLNTKGLKLGMYQENRKFTGTLGAIKSASALLYVLAGRFARINGFDEALILNQHGRICEAVSSNVFLVMPDGTVRTPSEPEGPLPGVMRRNLISIMNEASIPVVEEQITEADILQAEEVFLTNSVQGLQWVLSYRNRRYYHSTTKKLYNSLLQKLSSEELTK